MTNKSKYPYILFDWDGCLMNSLSLWSNAIEYGLSQYEIPFTPEIVHRALQSWNVFTEIRVPDMEAFTRHVYRHVQNHLDSADLNEGATELIITLAKKDFHLGIVSSTEGSMIQKQLRRLNLDSYFECVIGREATSLHKPHPMPLLTALQIMKRTDETVLMVGDSRVDVMAGKSAGVATAWLSNPHNKKFHGPYDAFDLAPNYHIQALNELSSIVM